MKTFKKGLSENALPMIVGNFLMGLIFFTISSIVGFVLYLILQSTGYMSDISLFLNEISNAIINETEPNIEGVNSTAITVLFAFFGLFAFISVIIIEPIIQSATLTSSRDILVDNKKLSIRGYLKNGFKNYFLFLRYNIFNVIVGTVFVALFIGAVALTAIVGSQSLLIVVLILFGLIFILLGGLFFGAKYHTLETKSAIKGVFFFISAWKKPKESLLFTGVYYGFQIVVQIANSILFSIPSLVLSILSAFVSMFFYEFYIKYFNPELIEEENDVIEDKDYSEF